MVSCKRLQFWELVAAVLISVLVVVLVPLEIDSMGTKGTATPLLLGDQGDGDLTEDSALGHNGSTASSDVLVQDGIVGDENKDDAIPTMKQFAERCAEQYATEYTTPNARAVIVYLDNSTEMLSGFSWLYTSWKVNCLDATFDIVVYHHPQAAAWLPKGEEHLIAVPHVPVSTRRAEWRLYKFYNSIEFVLSDKTETVLKPYTHILRTDLDVFLTKHWHNIDMHTERMFIGHGGYMSSDTHGSAVQARLEDIRQRLKLRQSYVNSIGTTWYGPKALVLASAMLEADICVC
eukprot:m.38356 g.38356  ORF g.38356 m.38356 type:complete len:290 (-) comp10188_c1_seq1:1744-2613(-)